MAELLDMIDEAKKHIQSKTKIKPEYGIILGTGLGKLVDSIEIDAVIPYETIPHFPVSTVETTRESSSWGRCGQAGDGHAGQVPFLRGILDAADRFPGARDEIHERAYARRFQRRGGINPLFAPGTIMVITDHINLLPGNPLIGPNDNRIGRGSRHVRAVFAEADRGSHARGPGNKIPLAKGVYAAMTGPSLETRAEYRMLKTLGADASA